MRALQPLYNIQIYVKEAEKGCGFRLYLKACKVLDDVTSDSRLFHVFATATGKAQSAVSQSHVDGTASDEVEDECSHCQPES